MQPPVLPCKERGGTPQQPRSDRQPYREEQAVAHEREKPENRAHGRGVQACHFVQRLACSNTQLNDNAALWSLTMQHGGDCAFRFHARLPWTTTTKRLGAGERGGSESGNFESHTRKHAAKIANRTGGPVSQPNTVAGLLCTNSHLIARRPSPRSSLRLAARRRVVKESGRLGRQQLDAGPRCSVGLRPLWVRQLSPWSQGGHKDAHKRTIPLQPVAQRGGIGASVSASWRASEVLEDVRVVVNQRVERVEITLFSTRQVVLRGAGSDSSPRHQAHLGFSPGQKPPAAIFFKSRSFSKHVPHLNEGRGSEPGKARHSRTL